MVQEKQESRLAHEGPQGQECYELEARQKQTQRTGTETKKESQLKRATNDNMWLPKIMTAVSKRRTTESEPERLQRLWDEARQ